MQRVLIRMTRTTAPRAANQHIVDINPYRYKSYRRNVSDKLRVELAVRTDVAKDTMSTVVNLAGQREESASDVIDYGMVFPHYNALARRVVESRATFPFSASRLHCVNDEACDGDCRVDV